MQVSSTQVSSMQVSSTGRASDPRQRSRGLSIAVTACLLLAAVLCGCSTVPPAQHKTSGSDQSADAISALLENRFGGKPTIKGPDRLHRLSDAQLASFKKYLRQPSRLKVPLHERVAEYLGLVTVNFAYDEKTQVASDSLATQSGNCMSLAVLTTALAEAAGVEIGYQLVNSSPVFQWEGDLILKGQHLRSVLFKPTIESNNITFYRSGIRIDYFPGQGERYVRKVNPAEYLSMYYNNLAADALGKADYNLSWWLLQESMSHQPNNVDALNVFALLYRRTGDPTRAEQIYQAGITLYPQAVVLMRNYRTLLRSVNRVLRGWCEYFRYGVSAKTFSYLDYFTWRRIFTWLRKRHPKLSQRELVRRHLPTWQIVEKGVTLFKPQSVSVIRYRYRGARIPTPWAESA